MHDPGGLLQPTRRGEGFGRSDQAGERVLTGGRREFQRPHGQVGRCLRRLTQGSGRRPVQSGQRRGIARVRGLEQMPGGQCSRCATAQQDLPVLAVQRLAGRPRDHLGGIFQPEGRAEDSRGRQQMTSPAGQPVQTLLDSTMDPLGQGSRPQPGVLFGDPDGMVVTQATDQLGKQPGVPGGLPAGPGRGAVDRPGHINASAGERDGHRTSSTRRNRHDLVIASV
jgi:hypothetical protein